MSFEEIITKRGLSEKTGTPFTHCSLCEQELATYDSFLTAKAYSSGACVLDAAQCFRCQSSSGYVSEQSMENLSLYAGRRFKTFLADRLERKMYHLQDPSCLVTGEELKLGDHFELYTLHVPGIDDSENNFFFVGPTAMEQMSELLSEETRKSWGDFMDKITPQTPDVIISPLFIG